MKRQGLNKDKNMKYGHEDKKTGIGLYRDCYAEQFADPGDIKSTYSVRIHGDLILEGQDPVKLAKELMKINDRLYVIADFLRRKGASRPSFNDPTGDK
jgi:hypothetical protein